MHHVRSATASSVAAVTTYAMTTSFTLHPPTQSHRRAAVAVAAVGSILIALYPSGAGEGVAHFSVGAFVRPVASLNVRAAPPAINVSANDVARGYVDVANPTQLDVQTNSSEGYVLNVLPRTNLFSQVQVRGLDSRVELGADGGSVVQRWNQNERRKSLSLTYRFVLQQDVRPGSYPWPLQFGVTPL
jgi:hypothetical protein